MVNSEQLLNYALATLEEADLSKDDWAIGGGTVLAKYFNHRNSKDIDVFIKDVQKLSFLSPRFNSACENAADYEEMANYISLSFPEGKVDFVAGTQITAFLPTIQDFFGKQVPLEDAVEIVCKKIYFRGSIVYPRDLFDLAIVYNSDRRSDLMNALHKIPEQFKEFADSFHTMSKDNLVLYSTSNSNSLLEGGKYLATKEADVCKELINRFYYKSKLINISSYSKGNNENSIQR